MLSAKGPNPKQWLVITDLDGTLLDHHTYSFKAAQTSLDALARQEIPVVINSSKTLAEIIDIKQALAITTPCIVENGSAIIYDNQAPVVLGIDRNTILARLDQLPASIKQQYRGFSECSVEDVIELTGLDAIGAKKALERQYTEPVKWLNDAGINDDAYRAYIGAVKELGLSVLAGGRFMHIMGDTDKGQASLKLKQQFQDEHKCEYTIIALGDSHNDIAMLEAADIAVVVRNDSANRPTVEHRNLYHTDQAGPAGWDEAIKKFVLT